MPKNSSKPSIGSTLKVKKSKKAGKKFKSSPMPSMSASEHKKMMKGY